MSLMTTATRVARAPQLQARPELKVVRAVARRTPRVPFLGVCAALLTLGLLGLLVLNLSLSQGSYRLSALKGELVGLQAQRDALTQDLATVSGPANLATAAKSAGMVPAKNPAFIDLAKGSVVGVPSPADGSSDFTVVSGAAAVSVSSANRVEADSRSLAGVGLGGMAIGKLAAVAERG